MDCRPGSRPLPDAKVSPYVVCKYRFRGSNLYEEQVGGLHGERTMLFENAACSYIAREIWLVLFSISVLFSDGL